MTSSARSTIAGLLLLLWPFVLIAIGLIALAVAVFVLMVIQAFGEGIDVGLGALAALIGIPSLLLLWLSKVLGLLGVGRRPAAQRRA